MNEDIKVVTTYDIEGAEILEHIGLVQGSTVRARNFGSDIFANLKNLIGGELVGYSKLLKTSRPIVLFAAWGVIKSRGVWFQ